MKSHNLLGIRIDDLDKTAVLSRLKTMLQGQKFNHIATVNPEFLVEAQKNKAFKNIINSCALNVCDGFGISFWTKILYKKNIPRLTGVELAEQICSLAADQKKSVYFIGGFDVASKASELIKSKYPNLIVAGSEDGKKDSLSTKITQSKPDIVLVAFGAPAQELWIDQFKDQLPSVKIAMGIGGTFDFWTGKTIRAPKLMRQIGLEWLWRLITQPQRFTRIWRAVVVFSWLVLKEKLKR